MQTRNHHVFGFTNAAPLPQLQRSSVVQQTAPVRRPYHIARRKLGAIQPMLCIGSRDAQHSLTITREELLRRMRTGRAAKFRRWTTLSEIDVAGDGDTRVDVWLVIARDRRDFRIRGRVRSELMRICDRCGRDYAANVDGRFEVVLRTGDARSEEEEAVLEETLEEFGPKVKQIWLGDHVRDGVYLGVPTKALCSDECVGVNVRINAESGSVRYKSKGENESGNVRMGLGEKEAGARLMELKRRLEKEEL